MMFAFLYLPAVLGLIMVVLAKPVGVAFCRLGKANWKALTFGKTDMGVFYIEDKAPTIMRIVGGFFLVIGLFFILVVGNPLKGPGQFKAMGDAKDYLTRVYGGSSGSWKFSTSSESKDNSVVVVQYRFGGRTGSLRAKWTGDAYEFTEIGKEANPESCVHPKR